MTRHSKVIWSEGLFLQPQHFQQQERHLENELFVRLTHFHNYHWGFTKLIINQDLLKIGRLGILEAQGYFQDGTYFSIPDKDPAPKHIQLPQEMTEQRIFLCLPSPHWNSNQVSRVENEVKPFKYTVQNLEASNIHETAPEQEVLEVATLQTFIKLQQDNREGLLSLTGC